MKDENNMFLNDSKGLLYIKRGNKGLVILNPTENETYVEFKCNLLDGKYKDKAWGLKFRIKNGIISGKIPAEKIAVIY